MILSPFHDTILMIWNSRWNLKKVVRERLVKFTVDKSKGVASRERGLKPCLPSAELRMDSYSQYVDLGVITDFFVKSMLSVQQQQKSQQDF